MENLNKFTTRLPYSELQQINGGDGITEAVFRFLGWVSVIVEEGMNVPHANEPEGVRGSRPFE